MGSLKTSGKSRTLEEFMNDQIRFEQKRFEKLKEIIEKEEQEVSTYFKPQISKKS